MGMHERMRAMVIRQLAPQPKGKGVPTTLYKITEGEYDPVTQESPQTTAEYIGSGVRVNYSDFAYRNTDIVYGDFQVYLSPVLADGTESPRPEIDDTILFQGEEVKVINLSPFNDNGVNCGWKLQVRKG